MDFRNFDLNLLRVLQEIHRTRSVTLAGERLFLSQPATSQALGRLRAHFGDPLFVRAAGGLVPTELGERLAAVAADHLTRLQAALATERPFEPATATETFRLQTSDLGEMVFLPTLANAIRAESPGSRIVNVGGAADALDDALARGVVDVAIGILEPRAREVRARVLFSDGYVGLGGPAWKGRRLTAKALAGASLLVASPTATYHRAVDALLQRLDLSPRVALRVRHFGAVPDLLAGSDLLAIVPVDFARLVAARHGLVTLVPAVELPPYEVRLLWHARTENAPSRRWLRERVQALLGR